ncbi:hypothetical protein Agsp01_13600 [Agromyces sp. NBRC 114283]|nr:hypothetical protein Agsp01_13600 [Agromyces sp. NBRC 114283]
MHGPAGYGKLVEFNISNGMLLRAVRITARQCIAPGSARTSGVRLGRGQQDTTTSIIETRGDLCLRPGASPGGRRWLEVERVEAIAAVRSERGAFDRLDDQAVDSRTVVTRTTRRPMPSEGVRRLDRERVRHGGTEDPHSTEVV